MNKIKLGCPYVDENEINSVVKVLKERNLAIGDKVEKFEKIFADYISRKYGIAVSSGSFALELAFKASNLNEGDSIIVSPFNCGAVLYSILNQGLKPVWADIDLETYNLSFHNVQNVIEENDNIKGILITHLYGHPCNMDEFLKIKKKYDLTLIEDFAQAPGALYNGRKIGTYGSFSICSFGATKNLTTGSGGIILTDDLKKRDMLKNMKDNTSGDFEYTLYNCNMNDIQAAIGIEQIRKYKHILDKRRKIAKFYDENIKNDKFVKPIEKENVKHAYHSYVLRTNKRQKLKKLLDSNNIESAFVYSKPLHKYKLGSDNKNYKNSEKASEQVISLPIHPCLNDKEIKRVSKVVNKF